MPRPREFEPEDVVARAMEVFWQRGYVATSVQDLVEHTGISRASLYATFGDKHSLFLRALAHYRRAVVPGRAGILEQAGASLPQIREYFQAVADDLTGEQQGRGCLMANSAVELAARDAEVSKAVGSHLHELERAFAVALARSAERGEIAETSDIGALASSLMSAAQGLMVVGKAEPDRRLLRRIVDATLRSLG